MAINAGIGTTLQTIKVLLVDNQELMRQGIRNLLEREPDIQVIGEANSSDDAISLINQQRPQVVILDIQLRQGSGIDVSRAISQTHLDTKILVFTSHGDEQHVRSLISLGATGYLLKTCPATEFVRAVHDVAEGKIVFPSDIAETVMNLLRNSNRHDKGTIPPTGLTQRESEVLTFLRQGFKDKEIAEVLNISPRTVETHVRNILRKLKIVNRTQALAKGTGSI